MPIGEQPDRPQLHECAEVVAWSKKQPNGKRRRCERVNEDQNRQAWCRQGKDVSHRRILRSPLPSPDCQQNKDESEDGCFQHFAGANASQVDPHQQRDRNGHGDRECAPWAVFQGIHDDQCNDGEQDDQNRDDCRISDKSADGPSFFFGHFGERLAVAAHGEEQNYEILHATRENGSSEHPESSGEISELRSENGTDQRAGASDGGEVMSEDHPFVSDEKVSAIFESLGRSGTRGINREDFGRDEFAIEAIPESVAAGRGDNQPQVR